MIPFGQNKEHCSLGFKRSSVQYKNRMKPKEYYSLFKIFLKLLKNNKLKSILIHKYYLFKIFNIYIHVPYTHTNMINVLLDIR